MVTGVGEAAVGKCTPCEDGTNNPRRDPQLNPPVATTCVPNSCGALRFGGGEGRLKVGVVPGAEAGLPSTPCMPRAEKTCDDGDIAPVHTGIADVAACCAKCGGTPGCDHFTYEETGQRCTLKQRCADATRDCADGEVCHNAPDLVCACPKRSEQTCDEGEGVDDGFGGNSNTQKATLEECCAMCTGTDGCAHFTYDSAKNCQLKRDCAAVEGDGGVLRECGKDAAGKRKPNDEQCHDEADLGAAIPACAEDMVLGTITNTMCTVQCTDGYVKLGYEANANANGQALLKCPCDAEQDATPDGFDVECTPATCPEPGASAGRVAEGAACTDSGNKCDCYTTGQTDGCKVTCDNAYYADTSAGKPASGIKYCEAVEGTHTAALQPSPHCEACPAQFYSNTITKDSHRTASEAARATTCTGDTDGNGADCALNEQEDACEPGQGSNCEYSAPQVTECVAWTKCGLGSGVVTGQQGTNTSDVTCGPCLNPTKYSIQNDFSSCADRQGCPMGQGLYFEAEDVPADGIEAGNDAGQWPSGAPYYAEPPTQALYEETDATAAGYCHLCAKMPATCQECGIGMYSTLTDARRTAETPAAAEAITEVEMCRVPGDATPNGLNCPPHASKSSDTFDGICACNENYAPRNSTHGVKSLAWDNTGRAIYNDGGTINDGSGWVGTHSAECKPEYRELGLGAAPAAYKGKMRCGAPGGTEGTDTSRTTDVSTCVIPNDERVCPAAAELLTGTLTMPADQEFGFGDPELTVDEIDIGSDQGLTAASSGALTIFTRFDGPRELTGMQIVSENNVETFYSEQTTDDVSAVTWEVLESEFGEGTQNDDPTLQSFSVPVTATWTKMYWSSSGSGTRAQFVGRDPAQGWHLPHHTSPVRHNKAPLSATKHTTKRR